MTENVKPTESEQNEEIGEDDFNYLNTEALEEEDGEHRPYEKEKEKPFKFKPSQEWNFGKDDPEKNIWTNSESNQEKKDDFEEDFTKPDKPYDAVPDSGNTQTNFLGDAFKNEFPTVSDSSSGSSKFVFDDTTSKNTEDMKDPYNLFGYESNSNITKPGEIFENENYDDILKNTEDLNVDSSSSSNEETGITSSETTESTSTSTETTSSTAQDPNGENKPPPKGVVESFTMDDGFHYQIRLSNDTNVAPPVVDLNKTSGEEFVMQQELSPMPNQDISEGYFVEKEKEKGKETTKEEEEEEEEIEIDEEDLEEEEETEEEIEIEEEDLEEEEEEEEEGSKVSKPPTSTNQTTTTTTTVKTEKKNKKKKKKKKPRFDPNLSDMFLLNPKNKKKVKEEEEIEIDEDEDVYDEDEDDDDDSESNEFLVNPQKRQSQKKKSPQFIDEEEEEEGEGEHSLLLRKNRKNENGGKKKKKEKYTLSKQVYDGNFANVEEMLKDRPLKRFSDVDLEETLFLLTRRKKLSLVRLMMKEKVCRPTPLALNTMLYEPYFDQDMCAVLLEFCKSKQIFDENEHLTRRLKMNRRALELFEKRFGILMD